MNILGCDIIKNLFWKLAGGGSLVGAGASLGARARRVAHLGACLQRIEAYLEVLEVSRRARAMGGSGKVYAVRTGWRTGIFRAWPECEAAVKKFPGAEFKSFSNVSEARQYVGDKKSRGGQGEEVQQASWGNTIPFSEASALAQRQQVALAQRQAHEEELRMLEEAEKRARAEAAMRAAEEAARQAAARQAQAEAAHAEAAARGAELRRTQPHKRSVEGAARRNTHKKQKKKEKKALGGGAGDAAGSASEQQEVQEPAEPAVAERELVLRRQLLAQRKLNGALAKRAARERALGFQSGVRRQKKVMEDARRAKKKKRTVRQQRGVAGAARRHKTGINKPGKAHNSGAPLHARAS